MTTPRLGAEEVAELERFHSDGVVIEDGQRLYAAGSYCGDCRAYRPCPTAKLLFERREREAKLAAYERRERHVCGDPSAECDGDCAHEGWTAIELRKAEAKLARVRALRKRLDLLWMSNGQVSKALDEALADPLHLTPSRKRAEKD